MPACGVTTDIPGYHPWSCHRCHSCTKNCSCRLGIVENGHHRAWGPAAAAVSVPRPVPGLAGAQEAVPAPDPVGALGAVLALPVESLAEAAAVVAAALEGVVVLAVSWGGRDGRRNSQSWLSFLTTFAKPSTPGKIFHSPTSSTFACPILASMPPFPSWLPSFQIYSALSQPSLVPPLLPLPDLSKLAYSF